MNQINFFSNKIYEIKKLKSPRISCPISFGHVDKGDGLLCADSFEKKVQHAESKYTPDDVREEIASFLSSKPYFIDGNFKVFFDHTEKLDFQNIDEHLSNIKKFIDYGCDARAKKIFENGYFSSKEGITAFKILEKNYSERSKDSSPAPIISYLAHYSPDSIILAQKRGIIGNISDYENTTRIISMTNEKFSEYSSKIDKTIEDTGKSYEELKSELISKTEKYFASNTNFFETFKSRCVKKESVVASLKTLKILEDMNLIITPNGLYDIMGGYNADNIEERLSVLDVIKKRDDISLRQITKIFELTNPITQKPLESLLSRDDIPANKIIAYCDNLSFTKGRVKQDEILEKIKNDSFILTMNKIKNSSLDFTPKTKPTKLNPKDISTSSLALVHITNYEPENGLILSQRDKFSGSRNSVHFSLNHAVAEHTFGSWNDMDYAIILPYESTIEKNEGKFIEGMPDDIYTKGSIALPEGSIIIKYNEDIPNGEIKVSDYPNCSDVKMIETSEKPHSLVPVVLEKMGYSTLGADSPIGTFNYGEQCGQSEKSIIENYFSWVDFCDKNKLKPAMHFSSPNCVAEEIIEALDVLTIGNSWGNCIDAISYKDKILSDIDFVQKWQKKGYCVSYDTEKLKDIVKTSKTPKDALTKINDEMGIRPTIKHERFEPDLLRDYKKYYEEELIAFNQPQKMKEYIHSFTL